MMNIRNFTLLLALATTPIHGMLCQLASTAPKATTLGCLKFATSCIQNNNEPKLPYEIQTNTPIPEQSTETLKNEIAQLKQTVAKLTAAQAVTNAQQNKNCYGYPQEMHEPKSKLAQAGTDALKMSTGTAAAGAMFVSGAIFIMAPSAEAIIPCALGFFSSALVLCYLDALEK